VPATVPIPAGGELPPQSISGVCRVPPRVGPHHLPVAGFPASRESNPRRRRREGHSRRLQGIHAFSTSTAAMEPDPTFRPVLPKPESFVDASFPLRNSAPVPSAATRRRAPCSFLQRSRRILRVVLVACGRWWSHKRFPARRPSITFSQSGFIPGKSREPGSDRRLPLNGCRSRETNQPSLAVADIARRKSSGDFIRRQHSSKSERGPFQQSSST
jgi:hypothetical protein